MKVKYSRTTDKYLSLAERARLANSSGAKAFYSIHTNSFTKITVRGIETFSFPNSTRGRRLASDTHDAILRDKSLYAANRGLKTANFAVLRLTNMPSALVELAFISNVHDAKILKTKQKEFAKQIAEGIRENHKPGDTIFLDPGHGGKDPGAVGNGIREKDITLAVALEVGRLLKGGSTNTNPPTPSKSRNYVKLGDRGNSIIDIKKLQRDLVLAGFGIGHWGADGIYGKGTETAVYNFQREYVGGANGIAGPKTLRILSEVLAKKTNKKKENNEDRKLFYRVVTESFKERENAEAYRAELKKAGFDSFIDVFRK